MSSLEIDFESRSDVDLKTRGVYNYMDSPHTEALLASYRIGDGPLKRWRRGQPCPPDIVEHVTKGGIISAHNAQFERLLWQKVLTPRYGWPQVRTEQFRCTAATAAAMALPRDLAGLGAALGLSVQKDKAGIGLIRKFSLPRKPKKGEPPGLYFNEPEEFPEDFERFHAYCDTDVLTEAAADARMVPLPADEQDLWVIDQRINDRGLRIDRTSAIAAIKLAEKAQQELDAEIARITDGAVTACTQVERLANWIQAQGVPLDSLARAEIEDLLETDDLPEHVRQALLIRQEAAKTSVAKLRTFLERASADGRVRGAYLFCGAGTGRWSSVGAQMHNLPRPRKIFDDANLRLDHLFQRIRTGDPQVLRDAYGPELGKPLHLLADAIRGFIWAAPGHDLLVADYSGIEGVVAAWFAGEDWKVQAIREIAENPKLPDLYRRAAAGIFNCSVDDIPKSDPRRQVGKVAELALQYQGGPGAFRSMARNYALKLDPLYPLVWPAAGEERQERAIKRYEVVMARKEPIGKLLSREAFLAVDCIKLGWREQHPAIVSTWTELEDAARQAVMYPGTVVTVQKVQYLVARGFLWCKLPSGRCLAYGSPKIKDQVWVKVKDPETGEWLESSDVMGREEAEQAELKGDVVIEREAKSAVTALGVNSQTKKWMRFALYGGLAFENVVQAIARDLLANGIRKAEAAGYKVIGHVHDEIITEVPRGWGDVKAFERMICEVPAWAKGLPLTAAGYRGKRYRKD